MNPYFKGKGNLPNSNFRPGPDFRGQTPGKKEIKLSWILGGLFLITMLGVASLFIFFSDNGTNQTQDNSIQESKQIQNSLSPILCNAWDCMINAAKNCERAKLTNTTVYDAAELFFGNSSGMFVTTTQYYEIRGRENEACVFYFKTLEQHINFSEELKQKLIESGTSLDEIENQLKQSNDAADMVEGKEGTCSIGNNTLMNYFKGIRDNTLSGGSSCSFGTGESGCTYRGDLEFFNDCKGSYFEGEI